MRDEPAYQMRMPRPEPHLLLPSDLLANKKVLFLHMRAPANKSLDASGGSVFRIMTGPAMPE
jgi:hypothetical protein